MASFRWLHQNYDGPSVLKNERANPGPQLSVSNRTSKTEKTDKRLSAHRFVLRLHLRLRMEKQGERIWAELKWNEGIDAEWQVPSPTRKKARREGGVVPPERWDRERGNMEWMHRKVAERPSSGYGSKRQPFM